MLIGENLMQDMASSGGWLISKSFCPAAVFTADAVAVFERPKLGIMVGKSQVLFSLVNLKIKTTREDPLNEEICDATNSMRAMDFVDEFPVWSSRNRSLLSVSNSRVRQSSVGTKFENDFSERNKSDEQNWHQISYCGRQGSLPD